MFRYVLTRIYKFGGLPLVELKPIDGPVELFGASFEPVTMHPRRNTDFCFRFGSVAILTDHSDEAAKSLEQLRDLDILFLDALRYTPHPRTRPSDSPLKIVEQVKPKRAFSPTSVMACRTRQPLRTLPPNVQLSYDGMKMEFLKLQIDFPHLVLVLLASCN